MNFQSFIYIQIKIITAEGIAFPKHIGGNLNLISIATAKGLNLPDVINGYLILNNFANDEETDSKIRELARNKNIRIRSP